MSDETPELLPCPFCGDDKIMIKPRSCTGVPSYYQAECDECGATSHGSFHLDKIGAAKEWNTRPTPAERPVGRVDREGGWNAARMSNPELFPTARPSDAAVAWRYELAHAGWDKETYGHWNWHLSETKPHVPEGSIRNLTPLYALPPDEPARVTLSTVGVEDIACEYSGVFGTIPRVCVNKDQCHRVGQCYYKKSPSQPAQDGRLKRRPPPSRVRKSERSQTKGK